MSDVLDDIFGDQPADSQPSARDKRNRRRREQDRKPPVQEQPVEAPHRPGPPLPDFETLSQMDDDDFNPFGEVTDTSRFRHRAERPVRERKPVEKFDVANAEIAVEVLLEMEGHEARRLNVLPVDSSATTVTIACADSHDVDLISHLAPLVVGKRIILVEADAVAIRRRIDKEYSAQHEAARVAQEMEVAEVASDRIETGTDLGMVGAHEGANNRLLRLIIEQAIREGASDVHLEPTAVGFQVRMRIDGKLHIRGTYPGDIEGGLTTLVKVEAKMPTDNKHTPDSGVIVFGSKGSAKPVDIRVETSPTVWGQTVVMRLQNEVWRDLSTLGFSSSNEERFRKAIGASWGLVLATGPTGSGKTTSLYSALRERIDPDTKIITLENPVEYKIPTGVTQISVSDAQGMTFHRGLRSIVRQDPDVALVGEIRDTETAETAVDLAMTGHLVLSTLHTNDAVGAVPRMSRLGIEPFLLASSLLAVVAQRLVRRLCPECKKPVTEKINGEEYDVFTHNPEGCPECFAGFSGRIPIHEVLTVDQNLRDLIAEDAAESVLSTAAREGGMTIMREDGIEKIIQGVTSVAEVWSSTRD